MSKVYTFLVIIPVLIMVFMKTVMFYEYDTKQRYVKNMVDVTAHKVMITGVMTIKDRDELAQKLKVIGDFTEGDIYLSYGRVEADGTLTGLSTYTLGDTLYRGEVFSIYVQSNNQSTLSKMEVSPDNEARKLNYKAKAMCRIEKNQISE